MRSILFIILLSGGLCVSAADDSEKSRRRIEDLYVWKISDELKLTVKEEKVVSDIFKDINAQKNTNLQKMGQLMAEINKTPSIAKTKDLLAQYRTLINQYNKINLLEVQEIEKGLGAEKALRYLAIKSDIASKVKMLILQNGDKDEKRKSILSAPKVIEE